MARRWFENIPVNIAAKAAPLTPRMTLHSRRRSLPVASGFIGVSAALVGNSVIGFVEETVGGLYLAACDGPFHPFVP